MVKYCDTSCRLHHLRTLLTLGANVNGVDEREQRTALMWACCDTQASDMNVVRALVDVSASDPLCVRTMRRTVTR